jgi:hypothetical protein
MNKVVAVKVKRYLCNGCSKKLSSGQPCMGCGKIYCMDCDDKELTTFKHSLFFGGSDDGKFCKECLKNPPDKIVRLLEAYKEIKAIDNVWSDTYKSLEKKGERQEALIKSELNRLGIKSWLHIGKEEE